MATTIPFNDLWLQHQSLQPDLDAAIRDVIDRSAFVRGPDVEAFAQEFAKISGAPYCIPCANGTDALYIALRALGLGPGDEVITTAHTWIASAESITQTGGKVVFCDTQEHSFLISAEQIEAKITPATKGLIAVHLFGQAADMDQIREIAARHGLWVIEDCAQAHLATYGAKPVGTIGDIGTFSFYPGKNLGAMGDAGAIITRHKDLAEWMGLFANHGGKGNHEIEGINSRLDGLQAAVLGVKLKRLGFWTQQRQALAQRYTQLLSGIGDIRCPEHLPGREHVWHLYVVKTERRDVLRAFLSENGIATQINYPIALPNCRAYEYLGNRPEDFPNATKNQEQILSLPLYPEMTESQQDYVVETIQRFYRS
jgi:dTDP-4-amino-4,6-dideoxygalactose transaminase